MVSLLPAATLHLSFSLSVEWQHQQQRNRQPEDFPTSIPDNRGTEGGDLLNYPSKNARPQQE